MIGPIEHCTVLESVQWRDKITPELVKMNVKVVDPTKSEQEKTGFDLKESKEKLAGYVRSGKYEHFDVTMDVVIYSDLIAVLNSDFVIAYISGKMGGTIHEIAIAWAHEIPILAVIYDPLNEVNKWVLRLIRTNGQVFPNFHQLMSYLQSNIGSIKQRKRKNLNGYINKLEEVQKKLGGLLGSKLEEKKEEKSD